jgi:hypothetical protein
MLRRRCLSTPVAISHKPKSMTAAKPNLPTGRLTPLTPTATPSTTPLPTDSLKVIPRSTAFAASLAVPGLGQHLQGRHGRGFLYEGLVAGAGVAAVLTRIRYQQTRDDYLNLEKQTLDAYNQTQSARTLAIATQIALGVVWGINAIDAGITKTKSQKNRVSLDVRPTTDGGRILVHVPF